MVNEIYISYFYQIRNMNNNYLPLSTAMYDPKWFHDNKGNNHVYLDINDVPNGLRCLPLVPNKSCENLCRGIKSCDTKDPNSCSFIATYKKQLSEINFDEFMNDLDKLVSDWYEAFKVRVTPVLIVYETPNNQCSERIAIKEWLESHNIKVIEFNK